VIDQGAEQLMALERLGCVFRRQEDLEHLLGEPWGGHSHPRGRGSIGMGSPISGYSTWRSYWMRRMGGVSDRRAHSCELRMAHWG
jgi:hypothetical protein